MISSQTPPRSGEISWTSRFSAADPKIAAGGRERVRDAHAGRESPDARPGRAGNTLDFFEQEVERLSEELAVQSGRISAFKAENANERFRNP